jgi:tetratricopeptide (TPR) repeat protein
MGRIEKTVFISYRRTNAPWALAVFQNLTQHGYDVFFDFNGIASGDFERVIIGNIEARAHFLVLLTPSALERSGDPADWLRREIETALRIKRNIVPLMLEGFDFGTPGIANQLTGTLAPLKSYNALRVPVEYFMEAMDRLRNTYLNVALDAVLHPASASAQQAAKNQQTAATAAPTVPKEELTALGCFERGMYAADLDQQISFYTQAIHLNPNFVEAFNNRGSAYYEKGNLDGALRDYEEGIRLRPNDGVLLNNRATVRERKGELAAAIDDYTKSINLRPEFAEAFTGRGSVRLISGNLEGALEDHNEAIRLKPDFAEAFYNRGTVLKAKGDFASSEQDFAEASRLGYKPRP